MLTVVWTHDLEPVTIIDLPAFALEYLRKGARWNIPVPITMPALGVWAVEDIAKLEPIRVCTLTGEVLQRGPHRTVMAFVDEWNEANALALRPDYLAGQLRDMRELMDRYAPGALR